MAIVVSPLKTRNVQQLEEMKERKKRASNILIFGLKEGRTNDEADYELKKLVL